MISRSTRPGNSKGHKRWLPCRAWDFETLMYLNVFSAKFFGFFPYEYKNGKYVISKIRLAFATITACLYLAFQIYTFYCVNILSTEDSIQDTISANFFALLDGSVPTLMFLTSYSRLLMLEKVFKVSRILSPQDFNDMAKFLHLIHILTFLWHILYVPIFSTDNLTIPMVQRCTALVIGTASAEGMMFYMSFSCVLGSCFKKLNESLKRLREAQSELTEERLSRRESAMLLRKVKYYEGMHETISDALDQLNKSSRPIHIIFTTSTFVIITFDLYQSMVLLFDTDSLPVNSYLLFELLSFVVLRFGRFAVLIWVCETVAGHATEINTTIHDLANNCTDDTVKCELTYFALQVVHRDNAITATAFKMNGKLLSQVLNGVFMYLMILFQFLMSSNCTK